MGSRVKDAGYSEVGVGTLEVALVNDGPVALVNDGPVTLVSTSSGCKVHP